VHVTITRTRGPADDTLDVARIAGEEMLPWLQGIDGFEGLLMLSNNADGTTLAVTFWESREVADRHREARMRFRESVTATVHAQIEEVVDYEVVFAHLASRLGGSGT
jgi:heme-degrading monooxygenase HmoA